MPKRLYEIVAADDGEFPSKLMEWGGLDELWEKNQLSHDYNFLTDVAENCRHLEFRTEHWGGDAPRLSGIWSAASTRDCDKLEQEMAALVQKLIEKKKSENP